MGRFLQIIDYSLNRGDISSLRSAFVRNFRGNDLPQTSVSLIEAKPNESWDKLKLQTMEETVEKDNK